MKTNFFKIFLLLLLFNLFRLPTSYAVTIKVAALAPEGTTWAVNIKKMAKEIKKQTAGKVKMKVFLGGVAGDEPVVLKKIRIRQLHGGIFTGRALGEIYGDIRLMEVPFSFFADNQRAWKTLSKLKKDFNKGFRQNKFVNLGYFEIGNVYLVSTKPITDLNGLKGVKVWSWTGDELVEALVKELNLVSVPLGLPDVLTSLSTGVVEAAYSSPLGILALQWNSKVKYFLDFPITFSLGAFLVDKKIWRKISKENRTKVKAIIDKYVKKANIATRKENIEAKETLKSLGIKFTKFNEQDIAKGKQIRAAILSKLTGKLFQPNFVKKYENALKVE